MSNKQIIEDHNDIITTNNSSLASILTTINNLPEAGGEAEPILQSKTVTPTTSQQIISADSILLSNNCIVQVIDFLFC